MKIITLLILFVITSNAAAGPFGYRPSFKPSFRPKPSARPNYAPKPRVAAPATPATVKPAEITPTVKPLALANPDIAASASGNVTPGRSLGPVKPKPQRTPEPQSSSYRWSSGLTSPSPSSGSLGYYPYLWLLWQQAPQQTPLVYAPHPAAPSGLATANTGEAAFDPEAEPDLTPKTESSAAAPENTAERKETRGSTSRGGPPLWIFGAGIAAFVALVAVLHRSQPRG